MDKNKRIRCPECGFLSVIRKGKRSGRQRCQCQNCNSNFTLRRKDISDRNRLVWFEQWVVGKQSIEQLSERSGYSERTLKRLFYSVLPRCPVWHIRPSEKVNLMIDGTYFSNKVCLVLYRDNNVKATQLYRLTDGEWLEELIEDLNNLLYIGGMNIQEIKQVVIKAYLEKEGQEWLPIDKDVHGKDVLPVTQPGHLPSIIAAINEFNREIDKPDIKGFINKIRRVGNLKEYRSLTKKRTDYIRYSVFFQERIAQKHMDDNGLMPEGADVIGYELNLKKKPATQFYTQEEKEKIINDLRTRLAALYARFT